jgi:hypothetical protein
MEALAKAIESGRPMAREAAERAREAVGAAASRARGSEPTEPQG